MHTGVHCSTFYNSQNMEAVDKKDMVYIYIYILEYYSAIKNNKILPFVAIWMDLEIVILNEVSQRKNIVGHPLYVESKKKLYK